VPSSRTRLLALTCALAVSLTGPLAGVTPATAGQAAAPAGLHVGLDRLLAGGTPLDSDSALGHFVTLHVAQLTKG
jgi:serine protease AprX